MTQTYEIREVFYRGDDVESFPIGSSPGVMPPNAYGVYSYEADGTQQHVQDFETREECENYIKRI